jgi:hypothetical protein
MEVIIIFPDLEGRVVSDSFFSFIWTSDATLDGGLELQDSVL